MRRLFLLTLLLVVEALSGCASPSSQTVEVGGSTAAVGSRAASALVTEQVNAAFAAQLQGADAPPRLLKSVEPEMPHEAIIREVEGEVVAELSVDANGRVSAARVLTSSNELLSNAVVEAMLQWVFSPLVHIGVATRFVARQTYAFRLAPP